MRPTTLLTTVAILGLATYALAMRATTYLDLVADHVHTQIETATGKELKAYENIDKKLDKGSTSLQKEIALSGFVGKTATKKLPGDSQLAEFLAGTAMGLRGDVQAHIDEVQGQLDAKLKVKPAAVQKTLDKARAALATASDQTDITKRFKFLGKAESSATKAGKLVQKVGTGGGGNGNGRCPATARRLGLVEGAQFDFDGVTKSVDKVELVLDDAFGEPSPRLALHLYVCSEDIEVVLAIKDPAVAEFSVTIGCFGGNCASATVYHVPAGGSGAVSAAGTVDIQSYDASAGTISGTFSLPENPVAVVTNGSFTLTGLPTQ